MICGFCDAENATYGRCGFCGYHPADLNSRLPRPDDYTATCHNTPVIDDEHGAIALTNNPETALHALNAFYDGDFQFTADDLHPGWIYMEDRTDGPWHWFTTTQHPAGVPAYTTSA